MPKLNPSGKTMGQIAKEVASKSDETTGMRKAVKIAFNKPAPAQQGNSQKLSGSIRDLKKAIIKVDSNPVPVRSSGLSGVSGKLGGQHAGGQGASLGGGIESNYGGGGLNEFNK